jgi:hypothetical protein
VATLNYQAISQVIYKGTGAMRKAVVKDIEQVVKQPKRLLSIKEDDQ